MKELLTRLITKIQWRVTISSIVFLFLVLIASTWLEIRSSNKDYLQDTKRRTETIASHVTEDIETGEHGKDNEVGKVEESDDIQTLFEHILPDLKEMVDLNPDISHIRIFDRDGVVIVHTANYMMSKVVEPTILKAALNAKETMVIETKENFETISPLMIKGGQSPEYFLNVSTPTSILKAASAKRWRGSFSILILVLLLYSSTAFYFLKNDLATPIEELLGYAKRVADGDISKEIELKSRSEIGDLAIAFNEAIQGMKKIIVDIKDLLGKVAAGTESITHVSDTIDHGTHMQEEMFKETMQAINEFYKNIKEVLDNLNTLSQLAEDTSSSILEMASSIEEVDGNIENLTISIGDTSSSVEEITASLMEVSKAVDDLSTSTDETVSSLSEIDASIKDIEGNASKNAQLSQEVSKEGEKGLAAVKATHEGMEKIKEAVSTISTIIDELGKRSGEIGKILNVIDEVAEETNLLALNAAILAAQAGEYGKGFGVVAEEIRELAERTTSSTKEIDTLIKGVQSQTEKAISSVKDGMEKVEEGERLSLETLSTLSSILERFKESHEMSMLIARSTEEQSKGSKQVTENLQRISETIHHIAIATQEQTRGAQQIIHSVERMKDLSSHINRAVQEQTKGSKVIASNTEKVASSSQRIRDFVQLQKEGFEAIVETINRNQEILQENHAGVETMNRVVSELKDGVEALNDRIGRFRLE